METSDDDMIIVTPAMREEARAELWAMIRDGRWVADYEGEHTVDDDDEIVIVTPAMAEAARQEVLAMIREGRWPADYDGDDQVIVDDTPPPVALGAAE